MKKKHLFLHRQPEGKVPWLVSANKPVSPGQKMCQEPKNLLTQLHIHGKLIEVKERRVSTLTLAHMK